MSHLAATGFAATPAMRGGVKRKPEDADAAQEAKLRRTRHRFDVQQQARRRKELAAGSWDYIFFVVVFILLFFACLGLFLLVFALGFAVALS